MRNADMRPGSSGWWILIIALFTPIIVMTRSLPAILVMLLVMLITLGAPAFWRAYVLKTGRAEQQLLVRGAEQGTESPVRTWRNHASSIGVYAAASWPFLLAMYLLSARWGSIYPLIFVAAGLLSAVLLAIAAITARGSMRIAFGILSVLFWLWWLALGLILILGQPSE